jgi:pimeloyl-ACP methyl ester carboxylesterase
MHGRLRLFLVSLAGLITVGLPAMPVSAPAQFAPCRGEPDARCGRVPVPLDRSGTVPGTIGLGFVHVRAEGRSAGAVLALAGGPGEAALPLISSFRQELAPALGDHDLIVFDQRGTGSSGLLRCRGVERTPIGALGPALRSCADSLGPRRAFYGTADSVEDIEAVRHALGVERIALYGTSYGAKVALAYAQRYPLRVERLLLDSAVPVDGPDPFTRETFRALPRVLNAICRDESCRGITADPVADLAMLVERMQAAPLRGYVVDANSRRRARRLGRLRLLQILLDGDLEPSFRAEFPGAVRSALEGDTAPVLRLSRRAAGFENARIEPAQFSVPTFLATACSEGPLPWVPAASFSERWGKALAAASSIPDADFYPFDRAAGRASALLRLCAHWPSTGRTAAIPAQQMPDVPALLLSGESDLRTPSEEAAEIAARLPRASHVVVPRIGHSVLTNDFSGCATYALRLFFAQRSASARCPSRIQLPQDFFSFLDELFATARSVPTPVAPLSLDQVSEAPGLGGRAARTVTAARLTLADAIMQRIYALGSGVLRIGGLRAGRMSAGGRLDRYSYIAGVELSGVASGRARQRVRVTGQAALRGALVFDAERHLVTGRLGGRRIRAPLASTPLETEVRKLFRQTRRLQPRPGGGRSSARPPAGS